MGEIVGAALTAHVPTIMLPEEVRLEINEGKEITLVPGLRRMKAECLDRVRPDTVVVFDTHWESTFEHIVTSHDRRQGKFTSHELPRGMSAIPYDMPGDPELAKLIEAQADGRDDCWILACDDPYLPIFYGTVNIWTFLGDPDTRWISVGDQPDVRHERLPAVRRADRQRDRRERPTRRPARLGRDDPPVLQLQGAARARELGRAGQHLRPRRTTRPTSGSSRSFTRGDHAGVIDGMPEYRKAYPEGHFGHYLMMAAALGGRACTAPGEPFSEYEASVGTGQVHVWFERPESGWAA